MVEKYKVRIQKLLREKKLFQQESLMYQHIMEGMRQDLKLDDVLKLLVTSVTRGLGYSRAGLFLIHPGESKVELAMGLDAAGGFEKGLLFPIVDEAGLDPFSDIIGRRKKFFLTNNVPKRMGRRNKYKFDTVDSKFLNHAIVPIEVAGGEIIGLLAVDNLFRPRVISNADVAVLANFATQAGMAIASFQLHEKITNLTVTDPLTGVFNRRHFDQTLLNELKRSERYTRPCGLLYVDVDHFKEVNDRWGHPAGDEVLKRLAFTLRAGVRNIDTVARIGGEEFAVVLPETSPDGAGIVAERLVRNVAESAATGEVEKVTISAGVACFPEPARCVDSLKQLADKSLYAAKNNGRNRVGPLLAV